MGDLVEAVRDAGVVGAGGAGFPTHRKLEAQVKTVIANGAECEPLLHKDAAVMERNAEEIVAAVRAVMSATGAREGVIGLKEKHVEAVAALTDALTGSDVRLQLLGDYYPSGDEFLLVHAVTGRLIPAGGIPLQVGCVVHNVESLLNISRAVAGSPVTRKALTVAGDVPSPASFDVPLGVSLREVVKATGRDNLDGVAAFVGGAMMGKLTHDFEQVVTKTTGGLIVLPEDHKLVQRQSLPEKAWHRIGKSGCDQCSYCTEMCPRYLLGYDVQPHKVMRGLSFTATGSEQWNKWADLCCACGLCTKYACPEDLFPKEACDRAVADRKAAEVPRWLGPTEDIEAHPMRDGRHIPLQALRLKLDLQRYEAPAPWIDAGLAPASVRIRLDQHLGSPSVPVVGVGDTVSEGQAVAEIAEGALGARVHTSIPGVVTDVDGEAVAVEAG